MEVNIKSVVLYSYLAHVLGQNQISASQRINGFVLLNNAKFLQTHLNDLKERIHMDLPQGPLMSLLSKQDAQIEVELTLLLEGLITDHQVFRSFGYENLFEQGYLSYNLWKAFQSSNASLITDRLDNAFHAMSGDEDDVHLDQRARDDFQNDVLDPHTLSMRSHLGLSQAAGSGHVARVKDSLADGCDPNAHDSLRHYSMTVALVEAIRHSQRDIVDLLISQGANVDGPNVDTSLSPLIAALGGGNTYAISKLLSHMADLKILGQVQDAYCWRFATYLIMNHVSDFIEITNFPNSVIIRMSDFRVNISHVVKLTDRSKEALANFRKKLSSETYEILPRNRKRQGTYVNFDIEIRLCRNYELSELEKRLYSLKRTSEGPVLEAELSHVRPRPSALNTISARTQSRGIWNGDQPPTSPGELISNRFSRRERLQGYAWSSLSVACSPYDYTATLLTLQFHASPTKPSFSPYTDPTITCPYRRSFHWAIRVDHHGITTGLI